MHCGVNPLADHEVLLPQHRLDAAALEKVEALADVGVVEDGSLHRVVEGPPELFVDAVGAAEADVGQRLDGAVVGRVDDGGGSAGCAGGEEEEEP